MQISVKTDIDNVLKKFIATPAEIRKATMRAINSTAKSAKVQAAREIKAAGYGIKVSTIKGAISIRRATTTDLEAVVRATGRPIPLIDYGARQTSKGVSVNVKNGRTTLSHAFIAIMPSGHRGVFVRVGKEHKTVSTNGERRRSGLPIKELFGPAIPSAFANAAVQSAIERGIRDRFPTVIEHELRYLVTLRN